MNRKSLYQTIGIFCVACTFFAAIGINVANATTYYVAETGNDANPGTEALPFETIQKAADMVQGNDTVLIRGGTYTGFRLINLHPPANQWISFKSYPNETAVIDSVGSVGSGIRLSGASYIIIEDLEITQSNLNYTFYCDLINDSTCVNDAIQLTNAGRPAISVDSTFFSNANTDTHHIIIRNNNLHHNGASVISAGTGAHPTLFPNGLGNYEFQILNNHIHHNGIPGVTSGYGTYISGTNHLIADNILHDNNGQGMRLGNTSLNHNLVDSVIERNISYNNTGPFWHSSGSIQTTVGMGFVIWGGRGNILRNNIAYGNYGAGFQVNSLDPASPDKVYNNTIFGNGVQGILLQNYATATNNVSHDNAQRIPSYELELRQSSVANNNLVGTNQYNLFINTLDNSSETNNLIDTDPLFIDPANINFNLQTTSPAIDAGVTLTEVPTDFDGIVRPQGTAHDIGAFEHDDGSTSGSFPPTMSTPAPGSTLTSNTVTFIGGTTPQDVAHSLWVGTSLGTKDLHFGPMTGNTQVVTGLPTSGTIYVRYWTTDDPNTSNGAAWVFTEHTYTMNVGPVTHSLSVNLAGSGTGTVISAPTGITCGSTCSATYNAGTAVTLTATPTGGSTFDSWSGGGCSGNGACVVTMTQANTVTATFTAAPAFPPSMSTPAPGSTLTSSTVTFIGGTTPQDVAHSLWVGTALGTKDLHFGPMTGNTQEVSGLPTSGTIYVRYWTTDDPNTSNGAAWVFTEHTYTMNVPPVTHPLSVNLAGSGTGTVSSSPAGITCGSTCTATYNVGTTVTLSATPTSGSTFDSWSVGGCSGSGTCVVTMTQANTVTATFTAAPVFPPSMASPAPGSTLTSTTVTFIGGTTPQDVAHSLWVGTTAGSNNLHAGPMTGNTQVVSGLPNNGTIYVRYWTTDDPNTSNGAAWVFTEHTYTMNVP